MDAPSWITLPNIGEYNQDYSFDLNPIFLLFSSGSVSSVSLINGKIPAGLKWEKINQTIKITGVSDPTVQSIDARFTFRIKQTNGAIADRTFFLKLNALPIAPSWVGQSTFLGYQGNTSPQTYQLRATALPGQHIMYSLVSAPSGMSIDSNSGLLTYDANTVTTNSTILFDVLASTNVANSDVSLSVEVVINPLAPRWYTGSGSLGVFAGEDFFEKNLVAEDVTGASVTYLITSSSAGFPLTLDSDGLLYGRFSNPLNETTFNFTVSATSVNGVTSRSFSVTVIPNTQSSLLTWTTPSDLGSIDEGQQVEISIKAVTLRDVPVIYNVTGSLLPPHLMLDQTRGVLIGFCEYHAVPKEYYFNITVTDGYQSLTRQFKLVVNKIYGNQFFGADIPLTGDIRQESLADIGNVRVRIAGTKDFAVVEQPIDPPQLNIINGIVTGFKTPGDIISNCSPWFHTLSTKFGQVQNSSPIDTESDMLYREIVDLQNGANAVVYSSAVYNTNVASNGLVYPISIENLRKSLQSDNPYVLGGSGNGAVLYPNVDWNTGGINSIQIISSGSGYITPPNVSITGSGENAKVRAILGVSSINISSPGLGWNVGDVIEIPGVYISPALLTVESVGTEGGISSVSILNPGDYKQVIAAPRIYVSLGDAYAYISPVWGVIDTEIINSGVGYQCGINLSCLGSEILPRWQPVYFPMMELGKISFIVSDAACDILNQEAQPLWGTVWNPNYIVFNWQGIKWLGETSLDHNDTTFDGDTTRFHEVEDAKITIFDNDITVFNQGLTEFDTIDPLTYDLQQVWGSTIVDAGSTVFDLYTTIFDALGPRKNSNTLLRKWIKLNNRVYSSNNFVI